MNNPQIKTLAEKKLVGLHMTMSLAENKTHLLWRNFMPGQKDIKNTIGTDLYSLQILPPGYYENFSPANQFEKWALKEVRDFDAAPPEQMEPFVLPGGLYAVFHYKGLSSDPRIFQYIFATWLPASEYVLDQRPHFELLGEKYKNNDPESEEEIWIPVKRKS